MSAKATQLGSGLHFRSLPYTVGDTKMRTGRSVTQALQRPVRSSQSGAMDNPHASAPDTQRAELGHLRMSGLGPRNPSVALAPGEL